MLKQIKYHFQFASGGERQFEASFEAGSTMITGRNGNGKSLILEVFSYLLFGAQALRGKNSDYKKTTAEGVITIRGKDYHILRTKSKAEVRLAETGEILASQLSAVNSFIEDLLGYDFAVYRLSNWCAQGDIQALAQMQPQARKDMIDQVAGLTQVDNLIEFTKQEIRLRKTEISSIEQNISEPLAPQVPASSKEDAQAHIQQAQETLDEIQAIRVELSGLEQIQEPVEARAPMLEPEPEQPKPIPEPAEPEPMVFVPKVIDAPVMPQYLVGTHAQAVEENLAHWDAQTKTFRQAEAGVLQGLQMAERNIPRGLTKEQGLSLVAGTTREHWETLHFHWNQKLAYNSLLQKGDIECPNCHTRHPIAGEAMRSFDTDKFPTQAPLEMRTVEAFLTIERLQQDLAQLETRAVETFGGRDKLEALEQRIPEMRRELLEYQARVNEYRSVAAENEKSEREIREFNARARDQFLQTVASIDRQNTEAIHQWNRTCERVEHRNQMLQEDYQTQLAEYQTKLQTYKDAQLKIAALKERLVPGARDNAQALLVAAQETLTLWRVYDSMYAQYEQAMTSYNASVKTITEAKEALQDRERALAGLQTLKQRVKTYLVPSLSKVASYLLSEMTGGDFTTVLIDEDFEVFVDGKPLRTLSGSAKDVTNLAIRIGLGRILTHKVLGMMMLDEIDQGMDAERAAYTWQCIERVTPQIGQVLVVSHKDLRAENRLEVA